MSGGRYAPARPTATREYLGDGVYVDHFPCGGVVLTSENGLMILDRIVLEPDVLAALEAFVNREVVSRHVESVETRPKLAIVESAAPGSEFLPAADAPPPKVSIRVEGANDEHTTLRVFVNGASTGLLTLRTHDEAAPIIARLTGVQRGEL